MNKYPLSLNKCVVIVRLKNKFIPIVGINETKGGYFINYYLNSDKTIFGTASHDSRHDTLVASRFTKTQDLFRFNEPVLKIDDKEFPEVLPSGGITRKFFPHGINRDKVRKNIQHPLIVSDEKIKKGILVRAIVWPQKMKPTKKEMEKELKNQHYAEPLKYVFTPTCFSNKIIIGVYYCKHLTREIPLLINGPVSTNSAEYVSVGPAFTIRGQRRRK